MKKDNRNIHILVVDDEPLIQDMLRSCLKSIGYKVSSVNNGLEALSIMAEKDFDMVFMDLRMPVMDGLTAIKFLRQCEQREHLSLAEHNELAQSLQSQRKGVRIPVVALTGNIDDQEIVLQAGMDEYIPKPFKISTVYEAVARFCGKSMADSPAERRRHPRHAVKNHSVVVCNDSPGEVIDISCGGLAIKYAHHESIPNEWSVTVLNTTKNTATPYLPLKVVRKGEMKFSSSSGVKTQIIGAIFNNPDPSQQNQIKQFIYDLS